MSGKETEIGPKEAPKLKFESTEMEEEGALVPYKKESPVQDTPVTWRGWGAQFSGAKTILRKVLSWIFQAQRGFSLAPT